MKSFFLLFFFFLAHQIEVLICKSGTAYAYHNHYCRGLKECTHAVEKLSLQDAILFGRKACGYCYKGGGEGKEPPEAQCAATTKTGKRCSRRAGAESYCWQHSR